MAEMEAPSCRARAEGILPSKVRQVSIRANPYSHKHSLLAALQALRRAKFVPVVENKDRSIRSDFCNPKPW